MCFMLYLASDNEIPFVGWSQENPQVGFNEPITKPRFFSKKHIYYVNSTECCGCGFRQELDITHPDFSEREEKDKNQYQLYKYISKFLNDENFIELFGCWAGSENTLEERRTIKVEDLVKESFYFAENELLVIKKGEIK